MSKPSIIVSGNCQTGILAQSLNQIPWVAEQFDVFHEPIDYRPNEPVELRPEDWARCAIFWRQIGLSQTLEPDVADFKPTKTVTFPPLDFLPLWPFKTYDPLIQAEPDYPTSMYPEADRLVVEISEIEPEDLEAAQFAADGQPDWLKLFDDLSLRSVATLERNVEAETQRLVARDLQTNVQVAGYIMSYFRTERLFHTRNHPTAAALTILLKRLLAATWPRECGTGKILSGAPERVFSGWDPFSHYQVPVNRRVAEKLKLEWWREDMRHRTDASVRTQATQTGDEYFATYIAERRRRWLASQADEKAKDAAATVESLDIQREDLPPCRICECASVRAFTRKGGRLMTICVDCRHVTWEMTPTETEMTDYYVKNYTGIHNQLERQRAVRDYCVGHVQEIISITGKNASAVTMADVGCSYPVFLECAKEAGCATLGIDWSQEAREYGKSTGIPIMTPPEFLESVEDGSLDVLRYSHTLEHLIDPFGSLKEHLSKLKRGGLVYITQPNFPVFKAEWRHTDLHDSDWPSHLQFFNPISLSVMLKRCNIRLLKLFSVTDEVEAEKRYRPMIDVVFAARMLEPFAAIGEPDRGPICNYPFYAGMNVGAYGIYGE